jgi:hypothetical protein
VFLRGFACREGVVLKAREEEAVVSADQSCRRGTEAEATAYRKSEDKVLLLLLLLLLPTMSAVRGRMEVIDRSLADGKK